MDKKKLDRIASTYHLKKKINDIHIENINQHYFAQWILNLVKNKNVLEMGYGDGILTSYLAFQKRSKLDLIEGSELLVKKAQKKHRNINIINELFENYNPEKKYDVIIASHVLEHVDNPVEILRKIKSWMHNKSICVIHVPNRNSYHRQLAKIMKLQKKLETLSKRDLIVGHQRVYSIESMKRDIKKSKLKIIKIKGFFLKFLPNSMMLNFSEKLIIALNKIAEQTSPDLCANITFVIKK